jgi:uncharacterized protein YggU (UPF0235/DUF167 family)
MLEKYKQELASKGEVYIRVKARPGASATEVKGILETEPDETLKIDVAAIPENGKANDELTKYLAAAFEVGKAGIKVISGAGDKIKLIKITK